MDKRSLIFIFSISIVLMGVNYYFTNKHMEEKRAWQREVEQIQAAHRSELEESVARRLVSLEELPLEQLSDQSWAVRIDGSTLTLPKNGLPPQSSGQVQSAELPREGRVDLQLVWLGESAESPVNVTLGVWEDGEFRTPLAPPASDALALMKTSRGWLPAGVYGSAIDGFVTLDKFSELATSRFSEPEVPQHEVTQEQYFVLQTPYQQLVFSNVGGALVEINMPFNDESLVREIEFDRRIAEEHPENARFPKKPFITADAAGTRTEHEPSIGTHYPLIRRTLHASSGRPAAPVPPHLYATNIVSKYPEVAELRYQVKEFTDNKIVFEARQRHRKITKTYRLESDGKSAPYVLQLDVTVDGDAKGLWLTSGVPEVELLSGSPSNELKLRVTRGDSAAVDKLSLPTETSTVQSFAPDWICNSNGFMGIILDPLGSPRNGYRTEFIPGMVAVSRLVQIDQENGRFTADKLAGYQVQLPLDERPGTTSFRIYAGPFATSALKQADAVFADPSVGYNPDYIGSQTFHGWFSFISQPFAKLLFIFMSFFHWLTDSWAASIILLTVVLRIILYPLNAWSMRSMRKMTKISPLMQEIQKKHKKDPQKAQMEIMNLYRQHKVNPMSGCFPMLIQMPFLIGMFDLLKSTFELRGAPFIPGWIDNLTAPDVVFTWGFNLPIFGNELHLLPLILGLIFFVQAKLNSTVKPGEEMSEQQRQQKFMGNMMTIMFTVMFYNFPSGLNIYWISSMLLGVVQQWAVNRQIDNESPPAELISSGKKARA